MAEVKKEIKLDFTLNELVFGISLGEGKNPFNALNIDDSLV